MANLRLEMLKRSNKKDLFIYKKVDTGFIAYSRTFKYVYINRQEVKTPLAGDKLFNGIFINFIASTDVTNEPKRSSGRLLPYKDQWVITYANMQHVVHIGEMGNIFWSGSKFKSISSFLNYTMKGGM